MFYTAKPVATVDPASARYEITDYQRNRGAELSVFGEPLTGFRVLGGLSYLHAEVSGERAIGAPKLQTNVGVEWDVPQLPGFTVNGRVIYTSSQYADAGNTQEVPSWSRLDLGARYTLHVGPTQVTVRGRIDNVTDRNQWTSVGGYPGSGYLVLGEPRTFVVNGTIAF